MVHDYTSSSQHCTKANHDSNKKSLTNVMPTTTRSSNIAKNSYSVKTEHLSNYDCYCDYKEDSRYGPVETSSGRRLCAGFGSETYLATSDYGSNESCVYEGTYTNDAMTSNVTNRTSFYSSIANCDDDLR